MMSYIPNTSFQYFSIKLGITSIAARILSAYVGQRQKVIIIPSSNQQLTSEPFPLGLGDLVGPNYNKGPTKNQLMCANCQVK